MYHAYIMPIVITLPVYNIWKIETGSLYLIYDLNLLYNQRYVASSLTSLLIYLKRTERNT